MYCFLLHIFMFQLSSALNPASTANASLGPLEAFEVHCAPQYIFLNTLHWNQARSKAHGLPPPPNTLESVWGIFYFLWHMTTILLVTKFSAWKQTKLSYHDFWSLFVCLLVLFLPFVLFFVTFFCLLVLQVYCKSFFPTFWFISKTWSLPL